jgi:hypothetical protein
MGERLLMKENKLQKPKFKNCGESVSLHIASGYTYPFFKVLGKGRQVFVKP